MTTGTIAPESSAGGFRRFVPPDSLPAAFGIALAFVFLTRWPLARTEAFDSDELGYLDLIRAFRFPMHHTLFMAAARSWGEWVGDAYRGFVILDMIASALALSSVWWWLRALVRPATAAAATLALAVAPVFWAYGAMAANYTAIPLVGSFLLGVAVRTWRDPEPWHPYASAVVLALGAGYRQDIGTFWLPVFFVILWRHRWMAAAQSLALFAAVNLAWLVLMVRDIGGWDYYVEASAEFAYSAGYLNSFWHLGFRDAPVRYAVKASMALLWTLGPGLLFVPRGAYRLVRQPGGHALAALMALSVVPALGSHLLIHFGVPGYALHYVPALLALTALGIGRTSETAPDDAPARLIALAAFLAAVFLFYPADFHRQGLRGSFDLAFARHTRIGLRTQLPQRNPALWRTSNSRLKPGEIPPPR